jgi:hypothetical protein
VIACARVNVKGRDFSTISSLAHNLDKATELDAIPEANTILGIVGKDCPAKSGSWVLVEHSRHMAGYIGSHLLSARR